ncbi:MAG: HAD family hydrolase [Planctomycetes bacterium]|nr:HAD family hydrolase [Planctomycetota bacterium]
MNKQPIQAVLFDFGDTIVDFAGVRQHYHFYLGAQLTYAFLRKLGQPTGPFTWYLVKNLAYLRSKHIFSNFTRRDFDSLLALRCVGEKQGVSLTDAQWEQYVWLWYEKMGHAGGVESDLAGTMQRLEDQGLKLGLISNTFLHATSLDRHMDELGLLKYLPERLYSYQFPFRKPDPRIFQAGAERIGEALPNILYVGDLIKNDIKPTLALGMKAALKRGPSNAGQRVPEGAWVVKTLSELPDLIADHNQSC